MTPAERQRFYRQRKAKAEGRTGAMGRPLADHGHAARYNRGCRCEACTEANRLKGVAWRAKRKGTG